MIFNPSSRAQVSTAERHWATKFTIRLITFSLALIGIAITAYTLSPAYRNVKNGLLVWALVPLGLSVLWNAANVIVRLCRASPIHPGANVGVDLIILLALLVLGAPSIVGAIENVRYVASDISQNLSTGGYSYAPNGTVIWVSNDLTTLHDCPGYSNCLNSEIAQLGDQYSFNSLGVYQLVALAFVYILMSAYPILDLYPSLTFSLHSLFHTTLFIWACIDTHNRRKGHRGPTKGLISDEVVQPQPPYTPQQIRLARDSELYGETPLVAGQAYLEGRHTVTGPSPWGGQAMRAARYA
ncbi:hypothetical protein MMC18_005790 [Xylographa bjoerkii]|nr:hypothetical protein [Xylographa bjoerkii]